MGSGKGKNNKATAPPSFWTPTRIGISCAVVILVALVASTVFRGTTTAPPPVNTRANNRTARSAPPTTLGPEALAANIDLVSGSAVKLSDYSGKVLVIDIWATWCGPCRQEIPLLKDLAKEYKDKGLQVIGLTIEDKTRDLDAVTSFVKEMKINYPIGWANRAVAMDVMAGQGGIPQTVVIGKDGKIKKHLVGFNMPISGPQLRKAIADAVAE